MKGPAPQPEDAIGALALVLIVLGVGLIVWALGGAR